MSEPTLRSIDDKLGMFMDSQTSINRSVSNAIEKMTDTASKADVQQIEINEISKQLSILFQKYDKVNDKCAVLETTSEVNKVLVKDTQDLKKMLTKSMVGVFIMFIVAVASAVFVNQPQSTGSKIDKVITMLENKSN